MILYVWITWEALFFRALNCAISHTFTTVAVVSLVENLSSGVILPLIYTVCKENKCKFTFPLRFYLIEASLTSTKILAMTQHCYVILKFERKLPNTWIRISMNTQHWKWISYFWKSEWIQTFYFTKAISNESRFCHCMTSS